MKCRTKKGPLSSPLKFRLDFIQLFQGIHFQHLLGKHLGIINRSYSLLRNDVSHKFFHLLWSQSSDTPPTKFLLQSSVEHFLLSPFPSLLCDRLWSYITHVVKESMVLILHATCMCCLYVWNLFPEVCRLTAWSCDCVPVALSGTQLPELGSCGSCLPASSGSQTTIRPTPNERLQPTHVLSSIVNCSRRLR